MHPDQLDPLRKFFFETDQAFFKRLAPPDAPYYVFAIVVLYYFQATQILGSVSRWRCLSWRDLFPDHYQVIVSLFCCSLREEGAFLLCAGGPSESSQAVSSTASNRFLTSQQNILKSLHQALNINVHSTVAGLQATMHSLYLTAADPPQPSFNARLGTSSSGVRLNIILLYLYFVIKPHV